MLSRARSGHSGVLLLSGEAGIGKTALLEYARSTATRSRFRVVSAVGRESETQFAFAGVYQLCSPLMDHPEELPAPQQVALDVALGQRTGAAPDRFLVGLAVLNLIAQAAHDTPLLCLVDDAQWLDRESTQILAFVARRLAADAVVMVFTLRPPGDGHPLIGLPELRLPGLADPDARALLSAAGSLPLDDSVRDRIVAEARGNPLALLELPRGPWAGQLFGGPEPARAGSIPRRLEDGFARQLDGLPAETRSLLVVAAAEPTGEVVLLWRAAAHLGLPTAAAAPAENAGLLEIGTHVRFRHPLARSAVYRAATPSEQRRAHGALAAATDPLSDPDRRAWHRAQAVLGHDEDAANELERSAARTGARGGMSASAAFLRRAAELTGEPALRSTRALAAAHAMRDAGAPESARQLLALAAAGPLDARQRARLDLLGAQIAFHLTRGDDVPGMLLDAAAALTPVDAALARESYLDALDAATIIGSESTSRGLLAVVEAAGAAPAPPASPTPSDLLLEGLVTSSRRGYEAGVPGLRAALAAFRDDEPTPGTTGGGTRRWLWLASRIAAALFDDETMHVLAHRTVRQAREVGALAELPAALVALSATTALTGELALASELAAEATAIGEAVGAVPLRNAHLVLAAWSGRRDETVELSAASLRDAAGHELGAEVTMAQYATAVVHNGTGNYPAAQDAAARACRSHESTNISLALPELVEAAARADQADRAAAACEQLESRARAVGTPWALGVAARSRALITSGPAADDAYREAVEQLQGSRMVGHLARTHLVYGEWLRREGHRQAAREQLRTAHDQLSGMGAQAFAERAARELRATGEHPRARSARPTDALTAQELHIARLVGAGATSREIATELFLSPRTIEAHLRSIFRKLGITSRRQLKDLESP